MALQASSKVKGITIEIGADTTKFGYEMKKLRQEATLIARDMRNVDNAMKLNPEDISAAADKLKLFREAADTAAKKVNTIKSAIEALNKAYADKSSKEYTEQLSYLERQLESATREQEVANARLKDFETNAGTAGQSAVELGTLIKGNVISDLVKKGLAEVVDLAKKIGRAFIDAQKELFNFAKDTVSVAAQYEDALGYTEQLFGRNSDTITKWVKDNSVALRIPISDMQVYANNYATAFSALGLKSGEMVQMTEDMLSLSADIRAATGKDVEEINSALMRSFTSSLRNLRQFGIFVGEADIKMQAMKDGIVEFSGDQDALTAAIEKSTKATEAYENMLKMGVDDTEALDAAEAAAVAAQEELNAVLGEGETSLTSSQRATALYNLVLEKLNFLLGQNVKESGLYNSQLAAFNTSIENLKLELGQELLPAFTQFVATLNEFIASPAGQALKEQIVDQFTKWGNTLKEMVESGRLQEIFDTIAQKAPEIIGWLGDVENWVLTNAPLIADLIDQVLSFFGIKTENQQIKEAFLEVEDQIKATAKQVGIDTDTMITAIHAYAETHKVDLLDIYNNWDTYSPQITKYIADISAEATSTGTTLDEKLSSMASTTESSADRQISAWDRVKKFLEDFCSFFNTNVLEILTLLNPSMAASTVGKWTITGIRNGLFNNLPGHALGGPAAAGQLLRVNDDAGRRTEMFVPSVPCTILSGDKTDKIINNYNNQRTMGDTVVNVYSYGTNAVAIADEIGVEVNRKLRMSGAMF